MEGKEKGSLLGGLPKNYGSTEESPNSVASPTSLSAPKLRRVLILVSALVVALLMLAYFLSLQDETQSSEMQDGDSLQSPSSLSRVFLSLRGLPLSTLSLVFLLLFPLFSVLLLPQTVLELACGSTVEPFSLAVLISLLGKTCGSTLCFLLGRYVFGALTLGGSYAGRLPLSIRAVANAVGKRPNFVTFVVCFSTLPAWVKSYGLSSIVTTEKKAGTTKAGTTKAGTFQEQTVRARSEAGTEAVKNSSVDDKLLEERGESVGVGPAAPLQSTSDELEFPVRADVFVLATIASGLPYSILYCSLGRGLLQAVEGGEVGRSAVGGEHGLKAAGGFITLVALVFMCIFSKREIDRLKEESDRQGSAI